MPSSARTTIAAVLLLTLLSAVGEISAQTWHEGFDGPQPSWRESGSDARYRVVEHQRLQGESHTGSGCEWLRVEAEAGGYIYLAHDVGRPPVIDELAPSVWIKSDRPGVQIAARIVLPRTTDPRTGRPLTTVVVGGVYNDVGHWQQLQLSGIPRLLTGQIHVLRMQLGPRVDEHEAYLDAILLNVYTGQGTSNVWIDDLDVAGYAPQQQSQLSLIHPATALVPSGQSRPETPLTPIRLPPAQPATSVPSVPRHSVKLEQSSLLVDNYPMLPRVIRHRGEPLEFLQKVGFNAVWLQRLPAPEMLEEANRLGLWLICPPPRPLPEAPGGVAPMADIGPQFDCVLAWDLGDDLTEADLEATERWADQVRAADHRCNRPLVCRPRTDLRGFSRPANILLIDRRPLGTTLEMSSYATWIRQQPLLASLGTPVWTTVQTQPNEALRQQLMALEPGYVPPLAVSPDQMQLLAYTAVASGSRGLVFVSDSPLDAPDPDTRQRAMTLELLNLELQLLEPWAAAGSFVANVQSNIAEISGAVLLTKHTRLLLPLWFSPGAQCVPSQSAAHALTLVAPGVPDAYNAYELTPHGAQPLRRHRGAGGLHVTLDEFGLTTQILLADEPVIVSAVDRRAVQIGRRIAELQRNLALHRFYTIHAIADQLAARTPVARSALWFEAARKDLQSCDAQLAAGDAPRAALSAQRATRSLRLIERAYWNGAIVGDTSVKEEGPVKEDAAAKEDAVAKGDKAARGDKTPREDRMARGDRAAKGNKVARGLVSPVTSPAALSFDTLPCHWRFYDRLMTSQRGPNRIEGGDFEDIDTMMRAGWRYILQAAPTVRASVNLDNRAARSGRLGLWLAVSPADPDKPPAVIENPPILFISPSVQIEAGQIVCIHGWVQVLTDITASTDGLLVVDSISGEALADRIGKTKGWRPFALYRVAPQAGPMYVTFALSGIGEVYLDDVAIEVLEGPAAMTRR